MLNYKWVTIISFFCCGSKQATGIHQLDSHGSLTNGRKLYYANSPRRPRGIYNGNTVFCPKILNRCSGVLWFKFTQNMNKRMLSIAVLLSQLWNKRQYTIHLAFKEMQTTHICTNIIWTLLSDFICSCKGTGWCWWCEVLCDIVHFLNYVMWCGLKKCKYLLSSAIHEL